MGKHNTQIEFSDIRENRDIGAGHCGNVHGVVFYLL